MKLCLSPLQWGHVPEDVERIAVATWLLVRQELQWGHVPEDVERAGVLSGGWRWG
ncbi:MAG: hypothetical protein HY720_31565 [Planctomycetes bacterium]|nr:hypothetical protein [Planctomycetota bacterium]